MAAGYSRLGPKGGVRSFAQLFEEASAIVREEGDRQFAAYRQSVIARLRAHNDRVYKGRLQCLEFEAINECV